MIRLSLALLLLFQAEPPGAVTGVVRSAQQLPAAGVRVYAQQVQDAADANSAAAPLEGQAQTDANGRYRLELAPGRYYIAAGSVSAPTYYPGVTSVATAKLVTVTSGGLTEGIDFGSFVAAARASGAVFNFVVGVSAIASGIFSGVVRNADRSPAINVTVVAFPTNVPPGLPRSTQTDALGRYRITNVPPDTYYIFAGYVEQPGFHSGPLANPQPIVMPAAGTIDALDISLPPPPQRVGTTVSGRVTTADGSPAVGANVRIGSPNPRTTAALSSYLPSNREAVVRVAADGTFRLLDVPPGSYIIQTWLPGSDTSYAPVDVAGAPIDDLRLSLPHVILSGRILLDDGSVPDPDLLARAALATTNNPNLVFSTLLPLSVDAYFAVVQKPGEYRFYFPNFPGEYEIRSITADSMDLMKETLKLDGKKSIFVDVRLARSRQSSPGGAPAPRSRRKPKRRPCPLTSASWTAAHG